jgi:hypothetical protein
MVSESASRGADELPFGSMREVYAAMYGPEVGADPDKVLGRLLRGKLLLAAAVAHAVLADPCVIDE